MRALAQARGQSRSHPQPALSRPVRTFAPARAV